MDGVPSWGVTDTLMKGSPDVYDALNTEKRDGAFTAFAVDAPRKVDLLADLDAAQVQGQLAHERDCLGFMMTAWPWPEGEWRSDEIFRREDMLRQIEDVRAQDADGILCEVLEGIEALVLRTEPTAQ